MANAQNDHPHKGWAWFEASDPRDDAAAVVPDPSDAGRELRLSFARCFAGPEGQKVLAHLRALTLGRTLGPDASDQMLRHMEGQRQLVTYILAQVERGRLGG